MGEAEDLYPKFSLAERDRRWAAVRKAMAADGLDVIVVPNNTGHSTDFQANVRWLTHVGGGGDADIAAVFPIEGAVTAIANRPRTNWQTGAQDWTEDVRDSGRDFAKGAVARLKELKLARGRIGVAGLGSGTRTPMGTILLGFYRQLVEAFPDAELIDATRLLDEIRHVKSDEEVAVLAKSQEIVEKAVAAEIAMARPGVRDWDLWAEVMSILVKNGSELPVHCNWNSGPNVNYTRTRPSMRRLQHGDLIINEIEASWIGYRAQAYQPVFVGVADPVHEELLKLQREVYETIMATLKPGVTVGELASLTGTTFARIVPKTGPAAGALCGLNMHGRGQGDDGPLITQISRRPEQLAVQLKENMVFILKPYIRTADRATECSWGDTVVVTKAGGRRLGKRPHALAVAKD